MVRTRRVGRSAGWDTSRAVTLRLRRNAEFARNTTLLVWTGRPQAATLRGIGPGDRRGGFDEDRGALVRHPRLVGARRRRDRVVGQREGHERAGLHARDDGEA